MRRSLQGKLILSYLAVALLTVLVVSVLIWLTSGRSLMSLVVGQQSAALADSVQTYYTANGTLEGFVDYYLQAGPPAPDSGSPGAPGQPPHGHDVRGLQGLVDAQYRALLPTSGYEVGQTVPAEMVRSAVPVIVDGKTVAWILPDTKFQFKLSPEETQFRQSTGLAIGLAALAGVAAAVGMGFVLARGLVNPIQRLTRASEALARGNLQQQVPVTSRDELGQLTSTFNQMSAGLAQADQQRKRLTADITHDLSTPLQIISGYVEMLEEDSAALTPHRIDIIKTEIGHLRRLVSDMSLLTQVEAGQLEIQPQEVQPSALLERVFSAYQPIAARQEVTLALDAPEAVPAIFVDEGRMLQVLKNLVENALRYTPAGGRITLAASADERVALRVTDTGVGIDPEDLPYVFDRFYRADKAREGNSGKLGLGLAICHALVSAQGGAISAESGGKGQGTTIRMTFPAAPPSSH